MVVVELVVIFRVVRVVLRILLKGFQWGDWHHRLSFMLADGEIHELWFANGRVCQVAIGGGRKGEVDRAGGASFAVG